MGTYRERKPAKLDNNTCRSTKRRSRTDHKQQIGETKTKRKGNITKAENNQTNLGSETNRQTGIEYIELVFYVTRSREKSIHVTDPFTLLRSCEMLATRESLNF